MGTGRLRTIIDIRSELYQRSRQVDCKSCGAPHLVSWCTRSPKEMGRQFRCSNNYFDLDMGSQRCREVRPGEIPAWKLWDQQQKAQQEGTSSDDRDSSRDNESPTATTTATVVTMTSDGRSVCATSGDITDSGSTTDNWDPIHISSDEHVSISDNTPPSSPTTTCDENAEQSPPSTTSLARAGVHERP